MKRIWRSLAALLALLLLCGAVSAAGTIDTTATGTLTVSAVSGKTAVKGMKFQAYQVSTVDANGALTPMAAFAAYADELDIVGKNDEAWQALAQKLERKIILDGAPKATAMATTDSAGTAKFDKLPLGLYLIMADGVEQGSYVYTVSPFFVRLPEQAADGSWTYSLTANAKPAQNEQTTDITVIKVWKDSCHESQRPKTISVQLLCNGKVYDTVTLPVNGKWKYTWENLEVNHKWTVEEKQQEGYAAPAISQNGYIFTITNTCNKPNTPTTPDLPQTGQLQWPVPVLFALGAVLILIGVIRRRGAGHEA